MTSSVRRYTVLTAAAVLLVVILESLGYRIFGSVVDLVSMFVWTVVATLLLVGFFAGRLIQRLVQARDMQRTGCRG